MSMYEMSGIGPGAGDTSMSKFVSLGSWREKEANR